MTSNLCLREDGAIIRVALEGYVRDGPVESNWFSEATNSFARSREPAIVDRITKDFPRPISSAIIPPLASSGWRRLAPLKTC